MPAPKIARVPGSQAGARKKVHAGAYTLDEAFNEEAHDLGPWIETPKSSRVESFRYDYHNNAVQMRWRDGGPAYIYLEVPYEGFRSLARAASKGRHINSSLDNFGYRRMTPEEEQAPSNAERKAITSRVRV
ncbi:MAG: KTSC domain-containing protein [Actinobacteria bacterium]|jgi:hypothetical protein|nr:MAG: KTSC domain-containing protein [Actinomycetota bacterium]